MSTALGGRDTGNPTVNDTRKSEAASDAVEEPRRAEHKQVGEQRQQEPGPDQD